MKAFLGLWFLFGTHGVGYSVDVPVPGHACYQYESTVLQRKVGYCLHRSHPELPAVDEPVVYFFHGMGGNATSWLGEGYGEVVNTLTQSEGFPATTFVSFDTESHSFFSDFGGKTAGGKAYETWFVNEFMPHIERTFSVCRKRECRATLGLSMGGFGALRTAFRHSDLFSAVAVNCPALPPFSAYRPWADWKAYFTRHPVGQAEGTFLLVYLRKMFPTQDMSDGNDPSFLADHFADLAQFPKIYFDMGGKDYFGFQEGYERFKEILDRRGLGYKSYLDPEAGHDISHKTRWNSVRFLRDAWRIPQTAPALN